MTSIRDKNTSAAYHSTRDLCERFRCSSRTLFRRIKRDLNPFPEPCIRHVGSCNLWDAQEIAAWEQRERERSRQGTAGGRSDNGKVEVRV